MDVNLVMFREDGSRKVFALREGVSTIGRKTDCDIRVPLAIVSRRHAEVSVGEEGVSIKDLGAANGTYLNNQRVQEEELEPGDQIVIGPVVFTVQIDGQPPDEELVEVRTKISAGKVAMQPGPNVATSPHVYSTNEEPDPISALEELASSADQTAIDPEDNV